MAAHTSAPPPSARPPRLAALAYHALVLAGETGTLYTLLRGITPTAATTLMLLVCAGLLTLVYPAVGADPRRVRYVWGARRRALMPWLVLGWLALVVAWWLR